MGEGIKVYRGSAGGVSPDALVITEHNATRIQIPVSDNSTYLIVTTHHPNNNYTGTSLYLFAKGSLSLIDRKQYGSPEGAYYTARLDISDDIYTIKITGASNYSNLIAIKVT